MTGPKLTDTRIVDGVPYWPDYRSNYSHMTITANRVYEEKDTWREEPLKYWSTIWHLVQT